jgi:hypothetical protein
MARQETRAAGNAGRRGGPLLGRRGAGYHLDPLPLPLHPGPERGRSGDQGSVTGDEPGISLAISPSAMR